MKTMSGSAWRRQGSTLVTRLDSCAELLQQAAQPNAAIMLVSLRTVLRWTAEGWPAELPGIESVIVGGLDAVLDRCNAEEAAIFLRTQAKPIIRASQQHWTATGLLFLFPVRSGSLSIDMDERVCYQLPSGQTVAVSHELWNGAARDLREIQITQTVSPGKPPEPIGYHVARLS